MKHSEIFQTYSIAPKKALGQNFLVNDGILDSIASVVEVSGKDVIEVWPGYGALTERLLQEKPASLTLVEYDSDMVKILEDRKTKGTITIDPDTAFSISHKDVLEFSPERESLVVANIPYYITSPILFRFLYEVEFRPTAMVILMQREVGDKIRATKQYGNSYLSLAIENVCDRVAECFRVAPGSFVPPPKVESSVLYFQTRKEPVCDQKKLLPLLSAAFSHPRKKVISNIAERGLADKPKLEAIFTKLGLRLDERAEKIDLETWKLLLGELS